MWELTGLLLTSLRVLGVLITAPIWNSRYLPAPLRALLALYIGLALQSVPTGAMGELVPVMLLITSIRELLTGMALGYVVGVVFAAIQVGGHLIDMDMGFGIVNVIDPNLGQPAPVAGTFLYTLAMLIYLAANGHHAMLRALADSFRLIPLDQGTWDSLTTKTLIDATGALFWMALRIALPVTGALFVTTIALGIVARGVPQMNIFIVGFPIKIAAGLFFLTLSLPVYLYLVQSLTEESNRLVVRLMQLMAAG